MQGSKEPTPLPHINYTTNHKHISTTKHLRFVPVQ